MSQAPLASLNDLQVFASVARHRNFRRAAAELGVSPSALSHALRSLEGRLGVRLLNRTTRSVAPTAAGEQLLARLLPALQDIEGALDEVNAFRDTPIGTLRINAPRAACELILAPLVNRFLIAHPGMRVELVGDDSFIDIVASGFDAGVRFGESLQQDMVALPIGPAQRFLVVASPGCLRTHGVPAGPRDLAHLPCVRVRFPNGSYYRWEFTRAGEQLEIEVDGPLALGDMRQIVAAAEAGLGFAYMYEQYARESIAAGRLVSVLDDWRPTEPGFFLYYPSHRLLPAGLRAFIEFMRAESLPA